MTIETLIEIMDMSSENYNKYENLYNAINDWPIEVNTVDEYFEKVMSFLKINAFSLNNLEKANKAFNIHATWKHESISELILFLKK